MRLIYFITIIKKLILMSIEWPKIESGPSKKYKIEGHVLLDLREKTYDLEKQLSAVKMDLEKNNNDLNETKEKLSTTENSLNALKKEKDDSEKTITELESEIQSAKSDLNDANAKISKLEEQLKEESEDRSELNEKASSRYREIQKLKEVIDEKSNEVNELRHKIKTLMSDLSVGHTYEGVQKKIQEVVDHKGFITDREIQQLFKEFGVEL